MGFEFYADNTDASEWEDDPWGNDLPYDPVKPPPLRPRPARVGISTYETVDHHMNYQSKNHSTDKASRTPPRPWMPPPPPPTIEAEKATTPLRADLLPNVSTFASTDMQDAIELMQADLSYQEQAKSIAEAREVIKSELAALAGKYSTPGMRWGNLVTYVDTGKTKRTLDKKKLVEYISTSDLEGCYKTSKPFDVVRVRNLSTPEEVDSDEEA